MAALEDIYAQELEAIANDAVGYFQDAIERKGLVFSEQLRDDFEVFMVQNSTRIAAEIHFMYYGRYKDMKSIGWYYAMPPVEVMEDFVRKVGVNRFAWVPGYENSDHVPTETIALKRLAFTIAKSFHGRSVKRKQGSWYNETKGRMVNVARRRIMAVTAEYAAGVVVEGFG